VSLYIPIKDAAEFAALPETVRTEVMRWLADLSPLFEKGLKERVGHVLHSIARGMNIHISTVRRNYYLYKNGGYRHTTEFQPGDWRCLVNRCKAPDEKEAVPKAIVEEFRKRAGLNQRKSKPAHTEMLSDWRAGKLAKLPWPEIGPGNIPIGCSYRNLMRFIKPYEVEAMREGDGSAMAKYGPQFLSTRVGLYVGSHYIPDDLLRDFEALWIRGCQSVRVMELGCLDFFSGHRFAVYRRPLFMRENGTRDSVKEAEFRFFLAGILRNVGYSPRGTQFLAELGTAAIRDALKEWLKQWTGGLVTVRDAGITGKEQIILGKNGGRGGGKPCGRRPRRPSCRTARARPRNARRRAGQRSRSHLRFASIPAGGKIPARCAAIFQRSNSNH